MTTPRRRPLYRVTGTAQHTTLIIYHGNGTSSTRRFWVPRGGGYVYDVTTRNGIDGTQVGELLYGTGNMLWSRRDTLATTVRREMRRRVTANARAFAAEYTLLSPDPDELTGFGSE